MDTGSRPIMTYGEPAITGGSHAPKEFPSARQMVRTVLSVHDRSEPPSGPMLGEPAQTGSPRPRSLPRPAGAPIWRAPTIFSGSIELQVCGF